jgi:PIN domain nuclease of toxin-antitoxin system
LSDLRTHSRTGLLLDTHAWAWSLFETGRLTPAARAALGSSAGICLSVVSFYEIAFKAGLGKWPEMELHASSLPALATAQGATMLDVTPDIALAAGLFDWPHRDPFDRIIAATAQVMGLTLVSADPALDTVPGGVRRLW